MADPITQFKPYSYDTCTNACVKSADSAYVSSAAFERNGYVRGSIDDLGVEPAEFELLATQLYASLQPDPNDPRKERNRSFLTALADTVSQSLIPIGQRIGNDGVSRTAYCQTEAENNEHGGEARWFNTTQLTPGTTSTLTNLVFRFKDLAVKAGKLPPTDFYRMQMHIVEFYAVDGRPAGASPPVVHTDDDCSGFVLCLKRCPNVMGGLNAVTHLDAIGKQLDEVSPAEILNSFTLQAGEFFAVSDREVAHVVEPIRQRDSKRPASRIAMLIDFAPIKFLQASDLDQHWLK